ncbi:MAG: DNA polymerase III subunit beta [Pseudomonadota bacterium]
MATFARNTLLEPLRLVSGTIENRQTIPILSNVLLSVDKNKLNVTATDSEIQLTAVKQLEGKIDLLPITVPGKKFMDIVANLHENADIFFENRENRLFLTSEKSRFTLLTLPAEEFPNLSEEGFDQSFSLTQSELRKLLAMTHFSMANQDVRYYLNGMLLEINENGTTAVSTDGHRLALASNKNCCSNKAHRIILPRKAVLELIRLLNNDDTPVSMKINANMMLVQTKDFTFMSKLIQGNYPDYNRLIPKVNDKLIEIDRVKLKQALSRVAILSNQKVKGVRLQFKDNILKIEANNAEQENAEEEIDIHYNDEAIEFGFNVTYLLDIIANMPAENDKIRIAAKNSNSSVTFEPIKENDVLYLVMPMRL